MTSVGVVWSAVERIKCLMEKEPESLQNEGPQLLGDLKAMMELLRKGWSEKAQFGELEKEIVRLSYEIVDAAVDASKVAKWKKSSGNAKLQELQKKLNDYRKELNNSSSSGQEKTAAAASASEMAATAIPMRRPKNSFTLFRKNSTAKLAVKPNDLQGKPERMSSTSGSGNSEILLQEPKQSPHNKPADFNELKENLSDLSSEHSVVFIVGESGMGKTTFTRKLFQDPELQSCFKVSAWIPINHNFKIKKVLQLLLQKLKLGPSQDLDIRAMNEIQLIAKIFAALEDKNNLLVLDDIGAIEDWESIHLALPTAKSTKVIVTTSSTDFLRLPNSYQISGLTKKEIDDHPTFKAVPEEVRKAIFDISGGSPLLATILGKSLQPEVSSANQQQVVDELRSYMSYRGKPKVLEACYKRLAPELTPCLLYLGQFPHGQDIQVDKLYELLMVENLILPSKESEISLKTLTNNLKELAAKSFVEMGEDDKSCRLHDRVREFCISKGSEEEFFEVVGLESSKTVGPHTRRLAIYLSKYGSAGDNPTIQFPSQDTSKKILSLLIFDTFESAVEKSEWPSEMNDLKAFTNARVVKFDGVDFTARKVSKWIDRLELLRYLSFRGCRLEELPSSMSNLKQLETLDLVVDEDCKKMLISNHIFANMTRMVNLYLPKLYAASKEKTKVQLQGLDSLEILVNFDMEVCDVTDLSKFKKLKTFSTISRGQTNDLGKAINFINERGKDLQHSFVDITGFDCYSKGSTSTLEKLLECQFVHSIHIEGRIGKLPILKGSRAENVAEIFLKGCEIEDDPMDYLGKFEKLQSLVLANDAILGSEIVISAGLFPKLRSMKLHNLQYIEKITIEREALPELSTLQIHTCGCLEELSIPEELNDRLLKAQRDNGGDVYSVTPLCSKINITT